VRVASGGPKGAHVCQVARLAGPGRAARGRGDSARTVRPGRRLRARGRACRREAVRLATMTNAWSCSDGVRTPTAQRRARSGLWRPSPETIRCARL
jgi:hypothetical protein